MRWRTYRTRTRRTHVHPFAPVTRTAMYYRTMETHVHLICIGEHGRHVMDDATQRDQDWLLCDARYVFTFERHVYLDEVRITAVEMGTAVESKSDAESESDDEQD